MLDKGLTTAIFTESTQIWSVWVTKLPTIVSSSSDYTEALSSVAEQWDNYNYLMYKEMMASSCGM